MTSSGIGGMFGGFVAWKCFGVAHSFVVAASLEQAFNDARKNKVRADDLTLVGVSKLEQLAADKEVFSSFLQRTSASLRPTLLTKRCR
jgi:hypothetical protein